MNIGKLTQVVLESTVPSEIINKASNLSKKALPSKHPYVSDATLISRKPVCPVHVGEKLDVTVPQEAGADAVRSFITSHGLHV